MTSNEPNEVPDDEATEALAEQTVVPMRIAMLINPATGLGHPDIGVRKLDKLRAALVVVQEIRVQSTDGYAGLARHVDDPLYDLIAAYEPTKPTPNEDK